VDTQKQARYVLRPGLFGLGRRSLEGSRLGMVLLLHAMLNLIGRRGDEVLIDEGIRKARYRVGCIQARPEFELLINPDMNIVTYRYLPSEYRSPHALEHLSDGDQRLISQTTESLQRVQRRAAPTFVSRTSIDRGYHGRTVSVVALRAVLANPLTTDTDIDAVPDDQVELGKTFEVNKRTASVA
jgi:glutamate decarboxylase